MNHWHSQILSRSRSQEPGRPDGESDKDFGLWPLPLWLHLCPANVLTAECVRPRGPSVGSFGGSALQPLPCGWEPGCLKLCKVCFGFHFLLWRPRPRMWRLLDNHCQCNVNRCEWSWIDWWREMNIFWRHDVSDSMLTFFRKFAFWASKDTALKRALVPYDARGFLLLNLVSALCSATWNNIVYSCFPLGFSLTQCFSIFAWALWHVWVCNSKQSLDMLIDTFAISSTCLHTTSFNISHPHLNGVSLLQKRLFRSSLIFLVNTYCRRLCDADFLWTITSRIKHDQFKAMQNILNSDIFKYIQIYSEYL